MRPCAEKQRSFANLPVGPLVCVGQTPRTSSGMFPRNQARKPPGNGSRADASHLRRDVPLSFVQAGKQHAA